jgi:hypothetical protein
MTTLGKISEQIWRIYSGGNPTDDQEITRKEIELLVLQTVNKLLKIETLQVNNALGDPFPPHTAIAKFDNISVTAINDEFCSLTLPAQPISLPRNMGIWNITKRVETSSGSGVYVDDFEYPFVPVSSGQIGMMAHIGNTDIKNVLLSNVVPYEVRSANEVVFYTSRDEVGTSVNVQLLVADPAKVTSTDTLPLGSDQEMQVITEVMQILGIVPQVNDEVSDGNKQR